MSRLAATALAVSMVPTTVAGHPFWEIDDSVRRSQQRVQFLRYRGSLAGCWWWRSIEWNIAAPRLVLDTVSQATFAAGCFWGVEAAFRQIPGVTGTTVGYTGGTTENPSYRQVCAGNSGHAEAVEVDFDPAKVTYEQLLDVFWANHDPTTLNRQGWDLGSQYRSAIFFNDPAQEAAAKASLQARQETRRKPIVTEITPASAFYPTENYHQQYLEKRGQASCHVGLKPDQLLIDVESNVQGGTSLWQKLSKIGSSKT